MKTKTRDEYSDGGQEKKERKMECPFLGGRRTHRLCEASSRLYTPVIEDFNEYCSTEDHTDCPIFLAHVLRRTYREGIAISAN